MNRFIMADASACIGCRTCEVACVVSHQEQQNSAAVTTADFVPRIRVIKEDSFTTATVCHQCEDAPCANVCPVQAIRRDRGHIFVTPSRCIGCKSCMLACPFGAMTVVASASGAQAIKCDLCWHREAGPACVEACPTSALTQHTCSASASILNPSECRSGLHDGRNSRQPSCQARSISSARIFTPASILSGSGT